MLVLEGTALVDRDAAMPLYHQIFLQLRDEIVSGQRAHGSTLPTEEGLSALFGVSRITARRVLDELALQNFVERKRRVGTTVIFHSPVKPIEANIDQALDSLLALGHGTQVRVLDVATRQAPLAITNTLGLAPGVEIVRTVRVRSLDGIPLGYVESYMPDRFAAFMTRAALEALPMLEILARAGHGAETAEQAISAMLADSTIAAALEIEPRSALLKISRTVHDKSGDAILLTFAHYRADRFNIRLDLSGH
jgi:GntR family transcriptional regulator